MRFISRRWRYAVYALFVAWRLRELHVDGLFPLYDGVVYYVKAAWMAARPLPRALPPAALSYFPVRPPGPMWMALPAMLVHPGFAVFAGALLVWIVVLIEAGVRSALAEHGASVRNWAGVLAVSGLGVFYYQLGLFYVDALFTAQTFAALGLGCAWLRRPRTGIALACGVCIAAAVMTKPAGVFLAAAAGAGLLAGGWRQEALLPRRGRERIALRFWAQAAWMAMPIAAAGAALCFSPYRQILEASRTPMLTRTLARSSLMTWDIRESLLIVARLMVENVGLPVAVALAASVCVALASSGRGRQGVWDGVLAGLAATLVLLVSVALVPLKSHRYTAPAAAAALVAASQLIAGRLRRPAPWLAACALTAVVWQALCAAGAVPYRHWIGGSGFRYDMRALRGFLLDVDERLRAHDGQPVVLATDIVLEADALWSVQQFRRHNIAAAVRNMGMRSDFAVYSPPWPEYALQDVGLFPVASFLMANAPTSKALPDGSASADWRRLNDRLWDAREATRLGWRETLRTERMVLYECAGAADDPSALPAVARRAAYLERVGFESAGSPGIRDALWTLSALRGFTPAGRRIETRRLEEGVTAIDAHAPYPESPVPWALTFARGRGDTVLLRARTWGDGDGTHVLFRADGADGRIAKRIELPHGGGRDVALDGMFGSAATGAPVFTVEITPGPAGCTRHDAVWVGIRRGGTNPSGGPE